MIYQTLADCVLDLERHDKLIRIKEEVDPYLEMAAIHRRVYEANGPAIFYESVKGSPFPAVSNLFGNWERTEFIFRSTLKHLKRVIQLKADPTALLKSPWKYWRAPLTALQMLPRKSSFKRLKFQKTKISQIPQVHCWPKDGGAFVTLPQVFTKDPNNSSLMKANVGMYRVQLSGNDYIPNQEVGLHYQLHRGIGIHHCAAESKNEALKVSIFVGGPPAHSCAAVMPCPEGLSELIFAGSLAGKRFRYAEHEGHCLSADADFVITGTLIPGQSKSEGPFGDHLGYYSLAHSFPVLQVDQVYHRPGAIWPFTVVGRPPAEDSQFGKLVHELTASLVPQELPGVHALHAVDVAGVHPLLLAIGSERYTPHGPRQVQELLTLANSILGFGQCSLAKYLMILAKEDNPSLDIHATPSFFVELLSRVDWTKDLHFQTRTTMDTLDYSGSGLNQGSKLVIAAAGDYKRELSKELPQSVQIPTPFSRPHLPIPGLLLISGPKFQSEASRRDTSRLAESLEAHIKDLQGIPLIVLVDDSDFCAQSFDNFLWVCFTRSNPSHDIDGVGAFTEHKHWGCTGPLIIDARIKPHHAPPLEEDEGVERHVDRLGCKGASLYGII